MIVLLFVISNVFAAPLPGGTLDPTTIPKYVQPLVIPPEMPQSTASPAPAADYDIAVRQFKQQILPGGLWNVLNGRTDTFLPTTIWSYGREADPAPDITLLGGGFGALTAGVAPAPNSSFNYPAFTVETTSNVATNVRWINDLVDPATNRYLPHLLPVDQTLHWANPTNANCIEGFPDRTDCETAIAAPYTGPVPLVTHLHGAHVQPHSDGYPEAWWLPGVPGTKGIPPSYAERGSFYTQANNTNAVEGSAYYSYENTQPATTIWYHDHALGMTRLNVYAGPAGFWLVRGGANGDSFVGDGTILGDNDGFLPGPAPSGTGDPNFDAGYRATIREIPIVIQDRSFNTDGSLFYPQDRTFFDGFAGPYIGGTGTPAGPSDISGIWNPEAFFNTMVVNGTTWPKFEVAPARYRFRLLNGCNSRVLNLSMFVVTEGVDTIFGTSDDVLTATEVPFYQIGAEQGFLPNVVKIVTGSFTTLSGNGGAGVTEAAPDAAQALLLGNAERADVIIDFGGMANGTRIRMINTAPDAPFGGFPDTPSDPLTTGQVMDFIVNTALPAQPTDTTSTPPENLVLPAEGALGAHTVTRQLSLNELSSNQVCVEIDPIDGTIVGTLYSTFPGDEDFLSTCAAYPVAAGNVAEPMGPRQAQMGVVTLSGVNLVAVPKRWGDPITETPVLNSTELWEFYNTTADAHPVHMHLVRFEVVDRQVLNPVDLAAGNLVADGVTTPALPNELGYKDTVLTYPGQVTRVKAKFDIAGLYVWHCHIVEHEDNEMMRPFFVNADLLYANYGAVGLWTWSGSSWTKINTVNPTNMVASGSVLYADYGASGLWKWDGSSWTKINTVNPTNMVVSGSVLYADYEASGLWKWDGAWTKINTASPTSMASSGSVLYANFANGLWKWNGNTWSKINTAASTSMVASGSVLYADYGVSGLWKWDGNAWGKLSNTVPTSMVASDSMLFAKFTGMGLWQWDGREWSQLAPAIPTTSMVVADTMLYAGFTGYGLWKWDGGDWSQINSTVPVSMLASGSVLYADYGASGLWKWDDIAWSKINQTVPTSMVPGL
jgi:FtsP/CotA-like multicopper oxidase with cupredoxin domain